RVPTIAVFYDGFNDVFSAAQQGVAGLPQNEFNRRTEFNLSVAPPRLLKALLQNSHSFGLAADLKAHFLSSAKRSATSDPHRLALAISANYLQNLRIVAALASAYDFRLLVYWQPTLFDKRRLSPFEQRQIAREQGQLSRTFYNLAVSAVTEARPIEMKKFDNLARVVADVTDPLFIDLVHMGEE